MQSFGMVIDGRAVNTQDQDPVINPAFGEPFATCARATKAHVDEAVASAQKAFSTWRKDEALRRAKLGECAAVLQAKAAELAPILSQEQGKPQGPEGSLGKLVSSHVARQAARVHTYMGGQEVLLSGKDGPMDGVITEILISVPAGSIAGGTDEIQRNIISERVLQMPKEPSVDTNKPFKDVPRNVVAKA